MRGLMWHPDNTGLEGQVTRSYFVILPEESGLGQVLPVQYPLTYEKLALYDFDPNATLQQPYMVVSSILTEAVLACII